MGHKILRGKSAGYKGNKWQSTMELTLTVKHFIVLAYMGQQVNHAGCLRDPAAGRRNEPHLGRHHQRRRRRGHRNAISCGLPFLPTGVKSAAAPCQLFLKLWAGLKDRKIHLERLVRTPYWTGFRYFEGEGVSLIRLTPFCRDRTIWHRAKIRGY